jgi:hypothetical protein
MSAVLTMNNAVPPSQERWSIAGVFAQFSLLRKEAMTTKLLT